MPFPDPQDAITGPEIPPRAGLGEKDRRILEAMIENGFVRPQKMWFNQVVGNFDTLVRDSLPPNLREWFELTYSKRPDIILEEAGLLFVVEVKPYAGYVALGQSLMYLYHARLKLDPVRPLTALVLTDIPDPDFVPVAASQGVEFRQLGEFLEPRPRFAT